MFVRSKRYRDLQSDYAVLLREFGRISAENRILRLEGEQSKVRAVDLKGRLAAAETELNRLTTLADGRVVDLKARLAGSEASRSDLLAAIEGLRESVKRLEAERDETRQRVEGLKQRIGVAEMVASDRLDAMYKLEAERDEIKASANRLSATVCAVKAALWGGKP